MRRLTLLAVLALFPAAGCDGCDDSSSGGSYPDAAIPDFDSGTVDSGTTDSGSDGGLANECTTPTGGPTQHTSTINGAETWTAAGSPHVIPYDLNINGTLTIEPCAEVLIAPVHTVSVNATGKLIADGTATKRIHFGAQDPNKPFAQIRAEGGGTMHLSYATIDGGGDPQNTIPDLIGTIYAQGSDQYAASQPILFVDHVTVSGSKSDGITLEDGAGFAPGSQALTVTGAAQWPVSAWSRAVGTIPSGTYTGNAHDELLLVGGGGAEAVQEDATMHDWGVPYRVGNSNVGNLVIERQAPSTPGLATLTIDPGVTVKMKKGSVVFVQRFVGPNPANGALVVNGSAAKPVVFTSAEPTPAAGDWLGIWFGEVPAANDKIDYAKIQYAGGTSTSGSDACNAPGSNDAAIRIFGLPGAAFVTNTTIQDSAGHGVDRGWRNDLKPDFLPTNTFTNVAKCKESYPKDTNGGCPTTVPCP